jgi:hypothetical protein
LLFILENFDGWERGANWNDLAFMISHGGKVSKNAIEFRFFFPTATACESFAWCDQDV